MCVLLLITFFLTFTCSRALSICSDCSASLSKRFNTTQSFESLLEQMLPRNYSFTLGEMRPGICEATLAYKDGIFYVHKSSRGRLREGEGGTIYLRHKEFFEALSTQLQYTSKYFGKSVPDFLFNLETQDNPTCKYPRAEIELGLKPVKGVVHHSFCSPELCDGTFLLPMSYNQNIKAIKATEELDKKASKLPWESRADKLFWRGSNKGKKIETQRFGWKYPEMPRQRAARLLRNRKDSDVKFGFVPWSHFAKHKYILSVAGNTYSSLFKHALRSGMCILRQEERLHEWFEPFVKKWEHYVPVNWDLDDLIEKLEWAKTHVVEANNIGIRARNLGKYLFSTHVLSCYTYCGIDYFRKLGPLGLLDSLTLEKDFIRVQNVCNSKLGKRKDCFSL